MLAAKARNAYDRIAAEYYDRRHITTRNFEAATRAVTTELLPIPVHGAIFVEIGAGAGAESLKYISLASGKIISTDNSREMLLRQPRGGATLLRMQCCAWALPFRSGCIDGAFAFLADPYNIPEFYAEIARVLRPRGLFLISLPTLIWGEALRSSEGIPLHETAFVEAGGETVHAPSYLISDDEFVSRLTSAGFVVRAINAGRLPQTVDLSDVSPHVTIAARRLGMSVYDVPLVSVALAERL